jgi:hypothetical protein
MVFIRNHRLVNTLALYGTPWPPLAGGWSGGDFPPPGLVVWRGLLQSVHEYSTPSVHD